MSKIIIQLNQIQADAHALYVKLHNFHWNVKGMDFHPVHNFTEGLYNEMSTLFDDTAERAIIIGGKALLTIDALAKTTKIATETADCFKSKEIVEKIVTDFTYLLKEFKTLSQVAGDANDKGTEAFADDKVAELEKNLWMLNSMLK
ncbi:DNA protection during starvation protein [Aliarcobacter thereius]|uniref:DNA protection during starvation protein n=2 Tax=Aliarcobacter thereius TaxID=544718 RepID=A0A1C0BAC8_9BACT|nr:DNA starvation/stationary phase protection protein [Aliarcobacter thereius]OCL88342.1 DNA protection during starvation protein [Aliarcobacter thereius]OCL91832.1 DNA protection during starvation protein [Aliarcobacter thereius]OCL95070.1 DNA protection during starvation protein [Aliarcobacter thereius LMG 24486]OCM00522.1 DNA protection during starvation protein [Aliarcobacter thereius]QBF16938.1 DNA-binding ferritin-like protein [Aliarcobacter thereius LMG 24486]